MTFPVAKKSDRKSRLVDPIKYGRKDKQNWNKYDCIILNPHETEEGTYGTVYQEKPDDFDWDSD